jgi:DNA-binding SARP family transcriptional activator
LLRRARNTAATAALEIGDARTAIAVAEAAVTVDPFDEIAHRVLMLAHHANGELAHALLTYERLRATLADELGIDPTPATRDLHLALLRNKAVIAASSPPVPFRSV